MLSIPGAEDGPNLQFFQHSENPDSGTSRTPPCPQESELGFVLLIPASLCSGLSGSCCLKLLPSCSLSSLALALNYLANNALYLVKVSLYLKTPGQTPCCAPVCCQDLCSHTEEMAKPGSSAGPDDPPQALLCPDNVSLAEDQWESEFPLTTQPPLKPGSPSFMGEKENSVQSSVFREGHLLVKMISLCSSTLACP